MHNGIYFSSAVIFQIGKHMQRRSLSHNDTNQCAVVLVSNGQELYKFQHSGQCIESHIHTLTT